MALCHERETELFTLDACAERYQQELELDKQRRANIFCEVLYEFMVAMRFLVCLWSLLSRIDRPFPASALRGGGDLFFSVVHWALEWLCFFLKDR